MGKNFLVLWAFIIFFIWACKGPQTRELLYVNGIKQVSGDSIAGNEDKVIQFIFEPDYNSLSRLPKKEYCAKRDLVLGIDVGSWIVADSIKVYCDKNLPKTKAGENLIGNPFVKLKLATEHLGKTALAQINFYSKWNVANRLDLPDSAVFTFVFKLNNGAELTEKRRVWFKK